MLKIKKNYKAMFATIAVIILLSSLLFIGLTTSNALSVDEMNMVANTNNSAGSNYSNAVVNSAEMDTYSSDHKVLQYGDYILDCTFKAVNAAFWAPDYLDYNIKINPAAINGLKLTVEFHDSVENPVRYVSEDLSGKRDPKGKLKTAANMIERMVVILTVNGSEIYRGDFTV